MTDHNVPFSGGVDPMANDREAPAQTQGDSPRDTVTANGENDTSYQEYLKWKTSQESKSDEKPVETYKPEETAAYAPSAPSGRKVAPSEPSKSEVRTQEVPEDEVPQSYVWLGNGEVLLVNDEDLPSHSGRGAENGYWEKDGKVYAVVAVYPKETTIKEN
jgi:hypothetical protein